MPASYPKRADHFKKWSQMMLEQALVPDRLEYKTASKSSASTRKSSNGGTKRWRKRRKRFLRRKRKKQE